ncbi:hypothetical protein HYH03_003095 [Edaphochlamys debaryana]|uniref:Gamma-tubulin complex component n=1 Tax=Edaphochlamys debaryana TaxID=47281 RepID=A0A835YJP3_9CHLO|nr:hypothetical protein HYH03_003095 [Edaphochlamys debaryana]|eukprot:KAG2498904.1 hypothetical protein HYH03_003095 [Edaphochlamys debaryana]
MHQQQQQQQQQAARTGAAAAAAAGGPVQTPPPQLQTGGQMPSVASYHTTSQNPIYGTQDAGPSPLTLARRDAYTPAMTDTMAALSRSQAQTSSQRSPGAGPRGPGAFGGLAPAVPLPGDLFNRNAVAAAVARRPTDLQYLCEPHAWEHQRPALTGIDLIAAAGDVTSAGTPGAAAFPDPADVTPQELMVAERALVSDLLYAFLGVATQLVRPRLLPPAAAASAAAQGPCLTFSVREDLVHETLRERAAPLLPICDYVATLQRFVETRSAHCYGTVTHALAAALRGYLEDWQVMVAMMETQLLRGALDLTRLTFYAQQPAAALAVLADVAAQAANTDRTSAGLLNLLHARYTACAGNGPGRSLLQHLLTAAAAPYCACLERWLRQGVLDDPYREFMVQEDQALRRESPAAAASGASGPAASTAAASRVTSYWRGRYTLRYMPRSVSVGGSGVAPAGASTPGPVPPAAAPEATGPACLDIPVFMSPCCELILRTGKYQNVLRECGQAVAQPLLPQPAAALAAGAPPVALPALVYDPTQPSALLHHVRACHAAASSALLFFLLSGGAGAGAGGAGAGAEGAGAAGLVSVLHSIKHFFLLDQGDVLLSIMEVADEELCKPAKAINRTRLQSLLEMAVKMSSAASDPHAESLGFEMDPRPLEALAKAAAAVAAMAAAPVGPDGVRGPSFSGSPDTPYATPGPSHGGPRTPGTASRLLGPRDQDLPGWELFLPTLKVPWPATLVVGGEELLQYQLLFKHLWALKRAERQLEATWTLLQGTKRLGRAGRKLPPAAALRRQRQMAVAHALCHQLLFTVQELIRYGTLDVLEPLWGWLEEGVTQRAADVDAVIELHRDFLRRAASGLLVDQPRALRATAALLGAAAGFCRHMAALWERLQEGLETSSKATQVSASQIAAEQQRAEQLSAALDDLQRLLGEATGHVQGLVAAVREHYEGIMAGGGGGGGQGAGEGGAGGGVEAVGYDLEALQNLAERLDFARPAAGTLGSVLAEMLARA